MIVIMRDAIMPDCCNTCVCSEGYGCGITGTIMTTKDMESRPDWCPLEEVEPCEDAVSRADVEIEIANILRHVFVEYKDIAKKAAAKLPSVTPKQRWIPVSEKLPYAEYGESPNVYCYCQDVERGGKWATILYFNGGVWCKPTGETFDYKVLAWYPLPEKPYREEGDE